MPSSLFHYTTEFGLQGILDTQSIRPSLIALSPADARCGDGQYFSDAPPGALSLSQMSRAFLGFPFQGRHFTHYIEIDVSDLSVVSGRDGVFVILNTTPLDITGRILSSGSVFPP